MDRSLILRPQTKESPTLTPTHQTVVVNLHLSELALMPERLAPWEAGQYLRLAKGMRSHL